MHPNEVLLRRFHEAFSRRDAVGMNACYAAKARFSDPVFGSLDGDDTRAMWAMLCEYGTDLSVRLVSCQVSDEGANGHWVADYSFGPARRRVHNEVETRVSIRDGLIVEHADTFELQVWMRQALGPVLGLFASSSFLQKKVRAEARRGLAKYRLKRGI